MEMQIAALLAQQAKAFGFELTENQANDFALYGEFLLEYNEKVNLTAIKDSEGIAYKHFLDSILLTKLAELPEGAKLIDVGTGAGFPSVPIKIVRPDIELTLLDSLNKRVIFLDELIQRLKLQKAKTVHGRAEEAGRLPAYREQFDVATARAVAHLRELTEYCMPFVKVGGIFMAMKGYNIEQELQEAKNAINMLGGEIAEIKKYILPDQEQTKRSLVIIKKISQVSSIYPRPAAKMAKKPL